ncbi:hypothetical protein BE20_50805 [Sorangium cellulosum]|nr:hypothetical protein BE20_50805 [Sorangium cellulosum]
MPNGHGLVAGGRQTSRRADGTELSSAETYDPASNTWRGAGSDATASSSVGATGTQSSGGGDLPLPGRQLAFGRRSPRG